MNAALEENRDFISTYLCLNQAKPELKRNSKCYLTQKQVENAASNLDQKQKAEITLSYQTLVITPLMAEQFLQICLPKAIEGNPSRHSFSIFHPPQVLA